jgi:hypothetical protein
MAVVAQRPRIVKRYFAAPPVRVELTACKPLVHVHRDVRNCSPALLTVAFRTLEHFITNLLNRDSIRHQLNELFIDVALASTLAILEDARDLSVVNFAPVRIPHTPINIPFSIL